MIQSIKFTQKPGSWPSQQVRGSMRPWCTGIVNAFLPNSGRLILHPGVTVTLTPVHPIHLASLGEDRSRFPAYPSNKSGSKASSERKRLSGFQNIAVLRMNHRNLLLEVKSCTLFGNNVAMFPDAINYGKWQETPEGTGQSLP